MPTAFREEQQQDMKPTPSLPAIGVMLAALAVIAVASWVTWSWIENGGNGGRTAGSAMQTEVEIGGSYELIDHTGKTVTDRSFHGQYVLLYFGYGFCPDVCPTELANMATAMDILGPQADKVTPVFITVDPERDTPEFLNDYVKNFHPRMVGLTGSPEKIAAVAKSFKVYYAKSRKSAGDDYLMDHTSFVYLLGPDGKFLAIFRGQTDPKEMAKSIAGYMSGAAALPAPEGYALRPAKILPSGG
jgi:cytochrome oxidase Cu insertion factor (SCO1/SenC/PrrC family)